MMEGERELSKVKVRAVTFLEARALQLLLEYVERECPDRLR